MIQEIKTKSGVIDNVHICFSINDKYAQHCCVTIASILNNCSKDIFINFYVIYNSLSNENKKKICRVAETDISSIKFIFVNRDEFINLPIKSDSYFTIENYFRLKIPSLFNNLDKIIYLDSDILVLGDVKELWDIDLNKNYLACCEDSIATSEKKRLSEFIDFSDEYKYYNSGVLLINCAKWREDSVEQHLFEVLNKYYDQIYIVDQDALNCYLNKNIKYLDSAWNFQLHPEVKHNQPELKNIKIIHFVSRYKPWKDHLEEKYSALYFSYLSFTPWKNKTFILKMAIKIKFLLATIKSKYFCRMS